MQLIDKGLGSIKFNRGLLLFLVSYYCMFSIMPIIAHYISTYFYMGIIVLLFILILMRSHENFYHYISFMLPLLFLILLQILNLFVNNTENLPLFIYQKLLYITPIFLIYYLLINNNRKIIRILVIISITAFLATAFTTYLGLLENPDAARILATIVDSKDPNSIYWGKMNIGGFEFIYSVVLLTPMMVCLYKRKKLPLVVFAVIMLVFFLCVFYAQYATALMLFFSSIVLLFARRVFKIKDVLIIIVLIVAAYYLLKPLLTQIMFLLATSVKSNTLAERFWFIANSMKGIQIQSDVANRFDLYMNSINYFLKYPITGSWLFVKYGSGGHSFILDTLAQYGLFGGLALYVFFRQIYYKLFFPFKHTEYYGFMVWSLILFLVLSCINPTGFLLVLCFLVPGIAYIIQDKNYRINEEGVPYLESNVGL